MRSTKIDNNELIRISDSELKKFGKRVKNIRNRLGLLQKDLAESLGMSGGHLSAIEYGKIKVGYEFFRNIFLVHKVNPQYLFEGSGPIFLGAESEVAHDTDRIDFGEDSEGVRELLEYMRESPVVRMAVLNLIDQYKYAKGIMVEKGQDKVFF